MTKKYIFQCVSFLLTLVPMMKYHHDTSSMPKKEYVRSLIMEDVVETGITLRLWKSVLNSATPVADTGFHEGGFHSNNARENF